MGFKEYEKFISSDGLLNEFAMMWSIREAFPLHHIVFKQTATWHMRPLLSRSSHVLVCWPIRISIQLT